MKIVSHYVVRVDRELTFGPFFTEPEARRWVKGNRFRDHAFEVIEVEALHTGTVNDAEEKNA